MKKLVERLLIFFIGVPLVICLVLFLPYKNHLAVNCVVTILSALGAYEFAGMLKHERSGSGGKKLSLTTAETLLFGGLAPLSMTLSVSFGINGEVLPAAIIMAAIWLLISRVFVPAEKLHPVIERISAGFSIIIYPGLFMLWIIRMTLLPGAGEVILLFILTVFANDSLAWLAGMLFGEGNRGIVPASPNKSVAGFIGGILSSMLIGLLALIIFPSVFTPTLFPRIPTGLILGFCSGAAASLGDLAESAMKRCSGIKDSGNLIPGRGGVLDTIDSIALAAPVFYGLYWTLLT